MAQVSCYKPVAAPTNLTAVYTDSPRSVGLTWTDNATDETKFVVQRSFYDSLNFIDIATLPPNTTSYKDLNAPDDILVYYRVGAFRDSIASTYSNSAYVMAGNSYVMRNGTVTTCDVRFLDPGVMAATTMVIFTLPHLYLPNLAR